MSSHDSPQSTRLLLMPLRSEQDVVLCRNRVRTIAEALRFDRQLQIRIATAVSEIARNAFQYARGGTIEFAVECAPGSRSSFPPQQLVITVRDNGPGIPGLDRVLAGSHRSADGLGMGILGAKRLLDHVDIETSSAGTTVRLSQRLREGTSLSGSQLHAIVNDLIRVAPVDPLVELAAQNQDLIRTLNELQSRKEEIELINSELSETNRGVVALYDELDTIYRVGRVVATKLELDSLLQAITDATTDVSGAEIGAFFHHHPEDGRLVRQTVAGSLQHVVPDDFTLTPADLFEGSDTEAQVIRVDDIQQAAHLAQLGQLPPLRSFLIVPVRDSVGKLGGALLLGHQSPSAFTERTERILVSVAVQAAIGLENARLFRNVQVASAAKDQFLAMLSHELRTPLNPVFAILASLEQHPSLPEDIRRDILVMRRNLQLEARLIDDLLDITRIVKGKIPLQAESTDVHTLIEIVRETCQSTTDRKLVPVRLELEASRHQVLGDAARLQQVLWNLLSNAMKFTPEGGEIVIRTSVTSKNQLRIEVADTGRGIGADALPKIFRPFEQGDTSVAAQFGGLGLGLAITKTIVDAHGGEIRAESRGRGEGSTFIVCLPLSNAAARPETQRPAEPLPTPVPSLRILLVDDHEDTLSTLQRLLARRGHKVTTAASCQEAVSAAEQQSFDLLISDLGLPDCSGHELMREMRKTRNLTGIALSGFGMEADVERSREAGFSVHLTKPLDFKALEEAIRRLATPA